MRFKHILSLICTFVFVLCSVGYCDDRKPTVGLITQEVCPPCKPAKKLFEQLKLDGVFDGCNAVEYDKGSEVVKSLGLVVRTPMMVLIGEDGKLQKSVSTVDESHINALLSDLPIEPLEPVSLEYAPLSFGLASESQSHEGGNLATGPPPRIIRYTIATQYRGGTTYQGTFLWGDVDRCLNFLGRYWNIQFVRANSGTLNIVQANYQISPGNAFAWTRGNTIYISPVANYQKSLALTLKILVHEFGHAAYGGTSHNNDLRGIMSFNTGTASNFIESDAKWYGAFQWKSSLRPWHEPNYMKNWWLGNIKTSDLSITASSKEDGWLLPKEVNWKAKRTKQVYQVESSLHVAP
jgi:hypothetical protein